MSDLVSDVFGAIIVVSILICYSYGVIPFKFAVVALLTMIWASARVSD